MLHIRFHTAQARTEQSPHTVADQSVYRRCICRLMICCSINSRVKNKNICRSLPIYRTKQAVLTLSSKRKRKQKTPLFVGVNKKPPTETGDKSVYCNLMYSEDPRELGMTMFYLVRELFLTWIRDGSETAPDRFGPCDRRIIENFSDAAFYADAFAAAVMDLLWPRWDIIGTKKRIMSSEKSVRCFRRMKRAAKKRFR